MGFFNSLFCSHKWETRSKKNYTWTETVIVDPSNFVNPTYEKRRFGKTKEVLCCTKCGKIKQISY